MDKEAIEVLDLQALRNTLIRQEETIIFALIERSQFALSPTCYKKGAMTSHQKDVNDQLSKYSFLEYVLQQTEHAHAIVRRYSSPDENAFFPELLPSPVIPAVNYPQNIKPNKINMNQMVLDMYVNKILPLICTNHTDDRNNFGSSTTCDTTVLQAISKRIHTGKHVAEVKFQSEERPLFVEAIHNRDAAKLMELITHKAIEERLLKRVLAKAMSYGQDITDPTQPVVNPTYKVQPSVISDIYKDYIMPLTKDVEVEYLLKRLDSFEVGYLGPSGTLSMEAANAYFLKGDPVKLVPFTTIGQIFEAVLSGQVLAAVVPYYNFLTGFIRETVSLLMSTTAHVCGQINVPVEFHLVSASPLNTIHTVCSHTAALEQCRPWLDNTLPGVQIVEEASTASAAIRAELEPGVAAIATKTAAQLHNLNILAPSVHSFQGDVTRFIVISKYFTKTPTGADSSLLRFDTRNSAGALSEVLGFFTQNNINLTSIESRPAVGGQRFMIEVDGHVNDQAMQLTCDLLSKSCTNLHLVGSFQKINS